MCSQSGNTATTAEAAEANEGGQRLTCNAVNAMLEARCGTGNPGQHHVVCCGSGLSQKELSAPLLL